VSRHLSTVFDQARNVYFRLKFGIIVCSLCCVHSQSQVSAVACALNDPLTLSFALSNLQAIASSNVVGMVDLIARGKVTMSSTFNDNHNLQGAALKSSIPPFGWRPNINDATPWIEVDLESSKHILAVSTQGRATASNLQCVTKYALKFRSAIDQEWNTLPRDLPGNSDIHTVVRNWLIGDHVIARYVRLEPLGCIGETALRWDINFS
jgi:hypothetical protein